MASTSFDDSNWTGYDEHDSDSAKVDEAVGNLMIDLGQHASADFWSNVASDGGDIRVTNSAGDTAYSFELENFDSTAETGIIFFDSQGLSTSSTTTYRVYAGNSSASLPADSDTLGAHNVWESNWISVHPLTDATDSTSNNIDGTVNGATSGATGQVGDAYSFDGTDDRISLGDEKSYEGIGAITIISWVKGANSSGGDQDIFTKGSSSLNDVLSLRYDAGSGDWAFYVDGGDGAGAERNSANYNQGTWQQIVGIWDGSTITVSVDNSDSSGSSYSDADIGSTSASAAIGARGDTTGRNWEGDLDMMMIYQGGLSSNYRTTLYNNQNDNASFWTNNGWTATDTIGSVSEANASAVTLSDSSGVTKSD